jgi:DNA polymerase III subunit gamma/tau
MKRGLPLALRAAAACFAPLRESNPPSFHKVTRVLPQDYAFPPLRQACPPAPSLLYFFAMKQSEPSALYRKYRPGTWDEVVGQDHVVSVLRSSVEKGTIGHAYLFAGSRGTGKTSVARILAKELGTAPIDIYEMDAASNRGIDEIRAIRDAVVTLPYESKYKVYILDEAHMLTTPAWNAILKTLEEPPAHAVFMLATTELEKVPETVLSRCQVFRFKRPSRAALRDVAMTIAKKEGYALDQAGADLVAILADGSFRDAQSILQKVLSAAEGKKVSQDDVARVSGAPSGTLVAEYADGLMMRDAERALKAVADAAERGVDMKLFARLAIERLRAALLLKVAPQSAAWLSATVEADELAALKELGASGAVDSTLLLTVLEAAGEVGKSSVPELPLEVAVARVMERVKA